MYQDASPLGSKLIVRCTDTNVYDGGCVIICMY